MNTADDFVRFHNTDGREMLVNRRYIASVAYDGTHASIRMADGVTHYLQYSEATRIVLLLAAHLLEE